MKKALIICATPFQILAAMIICQNNKYAYVCDVLIEDTMVGSDDLLKRVKESGLFKNCYLVYTYERLWKNKKRYIYEAIGELFPQKLLNIMKYDHYSEFYDCIYTRTGGVFEDALYTALKKMNPCMEAILYDEGYSTYLSEFWKPEKFMHKSRVLLRNISKKLGLKEFLLENAERIFLMDGDLCINKMPIHIEELKCNFEDEFVCCINRVFGYDKKKNQIQEKYIFFEEIYHESLGNNGDMDIISEIANIVGKDNLVIKLHPRTRCDRFSSGGYSVLRTNIPWEVYMLNMKNLDKVLLTFSSGSVLNYKMLFECNAKTILLYKCFSNEYITTDAEKAEWFGKFLKKYHNQVYIPATVKELEDNLSC